MFRKITIITGMMALAAGTMPADFSYQETTRITGGALVGMMKAVGVFSSQARQATQPIDATVAVKGDRMVHRSPTHTTIIDLRAQTITSIDMQRRTYSVMTFDEMKQAIQQMQERMNQKTQNGQGQMNYKVSVNPTGKTREIGGAEAKEVIMKMEMEGTDQKSGQTGSMVINVDTWITPGVRGYREVREFYRRMAEKINWTPGGSMFMNRPDVAQGMAEVYKQSALMEGIPVLQLTTMGAAGSMPADGSAQPAGDQQPQQQQQSARPSIGSALGGRFGLGRKKQDSQAQQPAQGDSSASGVLLEMTTERKGFSEAPVDGLMFEIPAGFKQVESEMKRMR